MKPRERSQRIVVYSIVGALASILALLAYWTSRSDGGSKVARDFGIAAATFPAIITEPEPVDLADAADSVEPARLAAEATKSAPTTVETPTSSARALGRVVDLLGRGIAGLKVTPRNDPSNYLATSGPDGRFVRPPGVYELQVSDEHWFTLRDTEPLARADGTEVLVLVAPAIRVGGHVEDADGVRVAGARVRMDMLRFTYATFPEPLDRAHPPREPAETGTTADGRFEFTIPAVEHTRVAASTADRGSASIEAPLDSRFDLVLRLRPPPKSNELRVEGVVVHADGSPAVGAFVRYGDVRADVDADGMFVMSVRREYDTNQPLAALKPGYQAAVVADFCATIQVWSGDTLPFQRLVLGGAPLAIEGRVLDAAGTPRPGWNVQLVDPVLLSEGHIPPECVEALAGRPVSALTDSEGRFRLEGLQDRLYRLQATSINEFLRIESEPVPAGARNVQLVVPAGAHFEKIEGVVVSPDGSPIAGAEVRAALILFRTKSGYTMDHSESVTTDAEGRFRLARVPRASSKIDVSGDAILPASFDLTDHVDGRVVRITAARRCHARVAGVPASMQFTGVRVRDLDGQDLTMMQFQSGGWWSSDQLGLVDGGTPVFAVSETARTIVFLSQDGAEVPRPLALVPGEITTVSW